MSVVPDVSLNVDSDLVKTVDPNAHELAAQLVFANVSQRDKLLSTGHTMFEAQFQPLIVDNVCLVTVLVVDNTAIIPDKYQTIELENGDKYVVIDPDYSSFFREQRFTAATKDLRESELFDFIAQIEKIYLEHHVLVKRHLTQQFLANGSINPQFAPGRWIFTVSAGSEMREEIVKYAPSSDDDNNLVYGPYNPVLPELLATPDKKTVFKFLGMAHFIIE